MSGNKLGITLFSSLLFFASVQAAAAQSTNKESTQTQTMRQKSTASTDAGNAISKDKVRETQTALKKAGFDPGPIDGTMGAMTITALRNYQSHNGLEVTGTINNETENSLAGTAQVRSKPESNVSSTRSKPQSNASSIRSKPESNVSSMQDIRQIQQALTDLMYNPGDVNGMMTSQTQQAIREFQWLNNLPVTGNLDHATKIAIDSQWKGGFESSSVTREKPQNRTAKSTKTSTTTSTQSKGKTYDTSYDKEGAHRAEKAAEVLLDLSITPDKKIPNELLERAQAIAVIPDMKKGAFGIGGSYGKGLVSQRTADGRWSAPAYIQIGGGSFGLQLGISSTDLVLVFTERKALDLLEGGKDVKLGADAGVAAGPIGRSAEAGVNIKFDTPIYAYSRSKGLFAGVALDGAVLDIDNGRDMKVYGPSVTARDLLDGKVAANPTVQPFLDALDKAVPKKRISQK